MRRIFERLRARRRLGRDVSVWYHPAYAPHQLTKTARVKHLEPKRGEYVLTRLVQDKLLRASDVRPSPQATYRQLLTFHTPQYLADVARAENAAAIFGLSAGDIDLDPLLDGAQRAVGGTVAAAREVTRGGRLALNLGGGFHHAEPDHGAGFCVYNDVGVAIRLLRDEGWTGRVAIIDLDFHQGNGNSAAFEDDDDVLVFSIHGSVWRHTDRPAHEIHLEGHVDDLRYLASLRYYLPPALERFDPELVFYIAGMDVLGVDRLGTFELSLDGVFARDRFVLEHVREVPTVVTMAGGYSKEAWVAFYNLARYAISGRPRVWRPDPPNLEARFTAIAKTIDPMDLTRSQDLDTELSEADLFGELVGRPRASRLLDYYSRHGIALVLERYGLYEAVRRRGYVDFDLEMEVEDPSRQVVRVHGRKHQGDRHLLVELVVRRRSWPAPDVEGDQIWMLEILWLLLQDPTASFSLERPPLPGQEHPGLGIARQMRALLILSAERLGLAGLLDRPAHYHNAYVARSGYYFVDPVEQGRFLALVDALEDLPLATATQLVDEGKIRESGAPYAWTPSDHVLPVADRLVKHFASDAYTEAVEAARRTASFEIT